jgi:hypothetical protein
MTSSGARKAFMTKMDAQLQQTRAMATAGRMAVLSEVIEITATEVEEAVDSAARLLLGISGAEFTRRWNDGYYPDPDSVPGVIEVASLLIPKPPQA